jgi:hypothetical protein
MGPKAAASKKPDVREKGPKRGDQKFELPNKMKEKRGGGDEWRQWSRLKLQADQTEGACRDFYAKAFVPGEKGKADLSQMLTTLHVANPAMEDIRQPLDNPYLETDHKQLEKEVAKYRQISADRARRAAAGQDVKARLHLQLRLLSGEVRQGFSTIIPKDYEALQQSFLDAFPWHVGVVVAEHPDGSAIHPQRALFVAGQVACFRELAPPTDDLATHLLSEISAGWIKETYRPGLLALSTTLAAGDPCAKPDHEHRHFLHLPHEHHHGPHHGSSGSHHSGHHHSGHHSGHHSDHHGGGGGAHGSHER